MNEIKWIENWCEINSGLLHYYRIGDSQKPSLILLHGFMDNSLCWIRVAKELELKYDIIIPDIRGHGQSHITSEDFQIETMAEDILRLIHSLQITQVILMGHSMSGLIASIIAGKFPHLVSHLILEDPSFILHSNNILTIFFFRRIFLTFVKIIRKQTADQTRITCQRMNPRWAIEDIESWVIAQHEFIRNAPETVIRKFTTTIRWETIFQYIIAPTLLLISPYGILRPVKAQKIIQQIKNGQIVKIPHARHNIRRDNYEAFIEAIKKLI